MRLAGLLGPLLLGGGRAGGTASGQSAAFDVYDNADNARDRQSAPGVTGLGLAANASGCQLACLAQLGADPTTGCTAFTFYHANYAEPELAGRCFGDSTGHWAPFYSTYIDPMGPAPGCLWGNVTSGQNNPPAYRTRCTAAADCSYNGICGSDGLCECHPAWMGKHCGQLFLLPSDKSAGLHSSDAAGRVRCVLAPPARGGSACARARSCSCSCGAARGGAQHVAPRRAAPRRACRPREHSPGAHCFTPCIRAGGVCSSWGGSVLRGDDGTYHMWASEMVHNTGILVWMSNSRVRHAVSRTGPFGPYEPQDIAFGLWGHEPTVARAPTGEYGTHPPSACSLWLPPPPLPPLPPPPPPHHHTPPLRRASRLHCRPRPRPQCCFGRRISGARCPARASLVATATTATA